MDRSTTLSVLGTRDLVVNHARHFNWEPCSRLEPGKRKIHITMQVVRKNTMLISQTASTTSSPQGDAVIASGKAFHGFFVLSPPIPQYTGYTYYHRLK